MIAKAYSEALFELGKDTNQVALFDEQLMTIQAVIDKDALHFFGSFRVSKVSKKDLLKHVFDAQLCREIYHLLCLLVDKHQMQHVGDIAYYYHQLTNDYLNIVEGVAYSYVALTTDELTTIETSFKQRLNKEVKLSNELDQDLIGGVKVVIKDQVYDDSISYRLSQLKDTLLKGR